MATYLDQLSGEPERLRQALTRLVDQQQANVQRLEQLFGEYVGHLDQQVLRALFLRQLFGAGHGETMEAERNAEDSSKPVTELRGVLTRQRGILELYRKYQDEFERTGGLQSLSTEGVKLPAAGE